MDRTQNGTEAWFRGALVLFVAWVVMLLAPAAEAVAQQKSTGFLNRVFTDEAGSHKYVVFVPANYSPARKWPTILFLHGAGERGTDGVQQTQYGIGPLVKVRETVFPFIVVFPQCEDVHGRILKGWSPDSPDGKRALAILAQVEKDFSVDQNREILTGWSMGGLGAWELAALNPKRWLSVVTVSGGGDVSLAGQLKDVPFWAFHGGKDAIVRTDESRKIVGALQDAGGSPRYTELAEADHSAWKQVYDDDSLYAWMLSPRSDPAKLAPVMPRRTATPIPDPPFVAALDVPRAAYLRLGNDMLTNIAESIPQVVTRDVLSGSLSDISDYTEAEGYGFSVYMSGLSYSAQLARANVKAYRQDRLNIQLGLSNVQVTIGGISMEGDRHSASAGPTSIVIGHQRPVWLSFDVTPEIVDRKLKLRLVATSFSIPNDNWYVSGPGGVSVSGFGMTRSKVSDGIVSGLYGRKATIEQKVGSVVPNIIAQLEKRLDLSAANTSIAGLWPMPVYQPRLRIWPQEVSTDEKGVSLVLGVTAAAVDPSKPPRQVQVVKAVGPGVADVPRGTKLQVGVAPQLLSPLSDLLVQADLARIHVGDTPSQALAKLADPVALAEAIPDLKRYGDGLQVWAELVLAGPINVIDGGSAGGGSDSVASGAGASAGADDKTEASSATQPAAHKRFAFDVPQVRIMVSIKTDATSTDWTPCAEFDIALKQGVVPQLAKPTFLTRALAFDWEDRAQIEFRGKFAAGYKAQDSQIDLDKLKSLFSAGWSEFVKDGKAQADIPDVDLGYSKLRATDAGWSAPHLSLTFDVPGLKITNSSSDKPLVYETKGPYSGWGGPYTLKPGAHHDFPIAYPMLFRRQTASGYQMFTLPAGSHSEFRSKVAGTPPDLYKGREPAEIEKEKEQRAAEKEKDSEKSAATVETKS